MTVPMPMLVSIIMPMIMTVSMRMTVVLPVTMIVMSVPVAMSTTTGNSCQSKLTHFAVHLHLAELSFNFPFPQNREELGMQAHFWQAGHGDVGILLLLLGGDVKDFLHQQPGEQEVRQNDNSLRFVQAGATKAFF